MLVRQLLTVAEKIMCNQRKTTYFLQRIFQNLRKKDKQNRRVYRSSARESPKQYAVYIWYLILFHTISFYSTTFQLCNQFDFYLLSILSNVFNCGRDQIFFYFCHLLINFFSSKSSDVYFAQRQIKADVLINLHYLQIIIQLGQSFICFEFYL